MAAEPRWKTLSVPWPDLGALAAWVVVSALGGWAFLGAIGPAETSPPPAARSVLPEPAVNPLAASNPNTLDKARKLLDQQQWDAAIEVAEEAEGSASEKQPIIKQARIGRYRERYGSHLAAALQAIGNGDWTAAAAASKKCRNWLETPDEARVDDTMHPDAVTALDGVDRILNGIAGNGDLVTPDQLTGMWRGQPNAEAAIARVRAILDERAIPKLSIVARVAGDEVAGADIHLTTTVQGTSTVTTGKTPWTTPVPAGARCTVKIQYTAPTKVGYIGQERIEAVDWAGARLVDVSLNIAPPQLLVVATLLGGAPAGTTARVRATPIPAEVEAVRDGTSGAPLLLERDRRYEISVDWESQEPPYTMHDSFAVRADWFGVKAHTVGLRPQPRSSMVVQVPGKGDLKATRMPFVWTGELDAWVGQYEVTNAQFSRWDRNQDAGYFKGASMTSHALNDPDQPVAKVDVDDIRKFAAALTQQYRQALPPGYTFRLPTATEWRTFATGGKPAARYPWGSDAWPPPAGNFAGREIDRLDRLADYTDDFVVACPVNESGANAWLLYGTAGNAWECTVKDKAPDRFAAWLGGAWTSTRKELDTAMDGITEAARANDRGFRLVIAPPPAAPAAPAAQPAP